MFEPTVLDKPAAADSLDKPVAVVGLLWAVFPCAIGATGMVNAWSEYEALVHHRLGSVGLGASMLPVLSGLVFLVWFPLTGLWFVLLAARFFTGPLTMQRLLLPIAVTAVVAGEVMSAVARSRRTGIEFDPAAHLLTPYFWYSALISLGGLVAAGLSVWLLRRRPTNAVRAQLLVQSPHA